MIFWKKKKTSLVDKKRISYFNWKNNAPIYFGINCPRDVSLENTSYVTLLINVLNIFISFFLSPSMFPLSPPHFPGWMITFPTL